MPTYDYVCLDCAATTEVRATLAEKDAGLAPRCARCGGRDVRRAFAAVAITGRGADGPPSAAGGCCGGGCGCGS